MSRYALQSLSSQLIPNMTGVTLFSLMFVIHSDQCSSARFMCRISTSAKENTPVSTLEKHIGRPLVRNLLLINIINLFLKMKVQPYGLILNLICFLICNNIILNNWKEARTVQ